MRTLLFVALGGSLGAICRYGLGKALYHLNPHPHFSAGTLLANLLGCVLMGALIVVLGEMDGPHREALVAFLLTGFLGSLTTFSTFVLEFFKLGQHGAVKLMLAHALAHLAVGLLGLWVGHNLAERLVTPN